MSYVRLFVTLVSCALFSLSSVRLFVTLVPRALFSLSSVRFLLRECLAHCFL